MAAPYRPLAEQLAPLGAALAPCIERYLQGWQAAGHWTAADGRLWHAALELAEASGQRLLADFAYREVSNRVRANGEIAGYDPARFDLAQVAPGRPLLALLQQTEDGRLRLGVETQVEQLWRHPRTHAGQWWHHQDLRWQAWLEDLYLAQPFQCGYGRLTGKRDWLLDCQRQFKAAASLLGLAQGLPAQAFDESRQARWADPRSGRAPGPAPSAALGQYALALVDCHPLGAPVLPALGEELAGQLRTLVAALLPARDAAGLWPQHLDGSDPAVDPAGTLLLAAALLKGQRLGLLDEAAGAAGRQAFAACVQRFVTPQAVLGCRTEPGPGERGAPAADDRPLALTGLLLGCAELLRAP